MLKLVEVIADTLTSIQPFFSNNLQEWSQTEESSDDNKGPEILKWKSIIWLLIMTAWISILSEYLVHAIRSIYCMECAT
nr:vacuolar cation/proton exchanger 5 [Quercus suber]